MFILANVILKNSASAYKILRYAQDDTAGKFIVKRYRISGAARQELLRSFFRKSVLILTTAKISGCSIQEKKVGLKP